jgi:HupE / UreJ protein
MRAVPLALTLLVLASSVPSAHEIPADVTVQVFVKPEGSRLRLLVRAPLAAMRDVNFPTLGPGYLDLARADAQLRTSAMLWLAGSIRVLEGTARLPEPSLAAVQVSLPSDRSFVDYDTAVSHVSAAPLAPDTQLVWNQALLDALFEYPIRSDRSRFAIEPGFGRLGLRVTTVVRYLPPDGGVRPFEFSGDPGLLPLDPRWSQTVLRFIKAGFLHILDGIDHLLFLFCLVIPLRRVRPLVLVVTAFTVAHSITLIGSAFGLAPDALWFPPLVEMLIAMSIVYMALRTIVAAARGSLESVEAAQATVAFGFGLVHGFGFSFALRETMQFAGAHLLTALLSFNVGVELGQLLVLAVLIPTLHAFYRFAVPERIGAIILSALVAHTGWHWMIERGDRVRQFDFVWPAFDAALLADILRWAIVGVLLAGLIWFIRMKAPIRKGARNVASAASFDRFGAAGRPARGTDDRRVNPGVRGSV